MSEIERFEDIKAWQKARDLAKQVNDMACQGNFATDYALKDQIRRVSVSAMSNVAEGYARQTDKEFVQFLHIALGSVAEGQPCYRLLIAQDQPENRLLLHNLLEPLGFDLREAVNGQDAVTLFEQWHPELIWMDIRMPVMDGLEATRRIRAIESGDRTRIIAVTAHALDKERLEILAAGCDDFIRKPYRDREIFDALTKHLGVKFRYADEQAQVFEKLDGLDTAELKKLHPVLIQELVKAAERLDTQACFHVIGQISDISPELGERLRQVVESMQYKQLLAALENLAERSDP